MALGFAESILPRFVRYNVRVRLRTRTVSACTGICGGGGGGGTDAVLWLITPILVHITF